MIATTFSRKILLIKKNKYLCNIISARIGYVSIPTLKKGKRGRGLCLCDLALFIYRKSRPGGRPLKEGGKRSDAAEHITVRAHRVIPHEQVASEDFVVEVVGELAHRPFEVVSLRDDVPDEVFLAVPLAAVGFLEVAEFVVELHIIIDGLLANAIGGMS